MPKVPQFDFNESQNELDVLNTDNELQKNSLNNMKKNDINLYETSGIFSNNNNDLIKKSDEAKIFETYNSINQWCDDNLYSDNGYFKKYGKDAVNDYSSLLQYFDDYTGDLLQNNLVSDESKFILDNIIETQKKRVLNDINVHNSQQTQVWLNDVANESLSTAIESVVKSRNNPDLMNKSIQTTFGIIDWFKNNGIDNDTLNFLKQNTLSKIHASVLDAYCSENSFNAKKYLEKNKADMSPELVDFYNSKIDESEFNYNIDKYFQNIINSADDMNAAQELLKNIKDETTAKYVRSKVKSYFLQKQNIQKQTKQKELEEFYLKANIYKQSAMHLSYLDIPKSLSDDEKLGLMNYINSDGYPKNDNQIFCSVFEMMMGNSKEFKDCDLNNFRGFMSPDIYNLFKKKQELLNNSFSYTQLKDEKFLINSALKSLGLNDKVPENYMKIKNKVREFEADSGENVSDAYIKKIIKELGFKTDYITKYKLIDENINKKAEFIKDVFNDFEYHESFNKNLSFDDKEKIIALRSKIFKNDIL